MHAFSCCVKVAGKHISLALLSSLNSLELKHNITIYCLLRSGRRSTSVSFTSAEKRTMYVFDWQILGRINSYLSRLTSISFFSSARSTDVGGVFSFVPPKINWKLVLLQVYWTGLQDGLILHTFLGSRKHSCICLLFKCFKLTHFPNATK